MARIYFIVFWEGIRIARTLLVSTNTQHSLLNDSSRSRWQVLITGASHSVLRIRPRPRPREMVSSAKVVEPLQSAPSVVSRHSHSGRRHRSGRSHHGGSITSSSNDFPIFTYTGDTEVVIRAGSQEKRYLLHRLILAQCSGFFEASTNEDWSRHNASGVPKPDGTLSRVSEDDSLSNGSTLAQSDHGGLPVRPGEKRRWRYELDWENRAEDEEPILVQKVGRVLRIRMPLCGWLMCTATELRPHVHQR